MEGVEVDGIRLQSEFFQGCGSESSSDRAVRDQVAAGGRHARTRAAEGRMNNEQPGVITRQWRYSSWWGKPVCPMTCVRASALSLTMRAPRVRRNRSSTGQGGSIEGQKGTSHGTRWHEGRRKRPSEASVFRKCPHSSGDHFRKRVHTMNLHPRPGGPFIIVDGSRGRTAERGPGDTGCPLLPAEEPHTGGALGARPQ